MSFSFNFRARTVAAALAIAARKMDEVVVQQPTHAADKDTVLAAIKAQVGLIEAAAAGQHVCLNVSGSLSWRGRPAGTANPASDDFAITSANVSVGAYLMAEDVTGQHLPVLED